MSSISAQDPTPEPGTVHAAGEEVGVNGLLLQELGDRYAAYRQAVSAPLDPVRALGLTGEILDAVRRILATTQHKTGACPAKGGRQCN